MKGEHLGELEELVLLSVYLLEDDAYGASVQRLLEEEVERNVSLGAVYSALERLERKAFLASSEGGITASRGGRRKRYFKITPAGLEAVKHVRRVRDTLWRRASADAAGK